MSGEGQNKGTTLNFRGRSEHGLDGKGRLSLPARFQEVLRLQYRDERLMVSPWQNCLKVYPVVRWEEFEATLQATCKQQPATIKMARYILGGVVECLPDRQGRIILPLKMRTDCNLDREILVSGMISYFEIWDKAAWEADNHPAPEDFRNFELNLLEHGLL